jgi:hypothetical protein
MAGAQTVSYSIVKSLPVRYAAALARSMWTCAAAFEPWADAGLKAPLPNKRELQKKGTK